MANTHESVELRQHDGSMRPLEIIPDDDPVTAGEPWGGRGSNSIGIARSGLASAELAFFELSDWPPKRSRRSRPAGARFRDPASGLVSTVYREVVVRLQPGTSSRRVSSLLKKHGFSIKRRNEFVEQQIVVSDPGYRRAGIDLIDVSNMLNEADEVEFASPNFVSEFGRAGALAPAKEQWHLPLINASHAWALSTGKKVVVAVLDDGVELTHPALKRRLWRNPDKAALDVHGRDFFVRSDDPEHWIPAPKVSGPPWGMISHNDLHGTMCAGLLAASGPLPGVATNARVLPIRIFSANQMTSEEHVANAIRYAGLHAQIVSCSWFGGVPAADVHFALRDIQAARGGRGVPAFFAAGNDSGGSVRYPASDEFAIAVGAIDSKKARAGYSNVGSQLAIVAPGGDSSKGLYTTDLSTHGRGTNPGDATARLDGAYTNGFWGTSAATPVAAGVAALMLSRAPKLEAIGVRETLQATAAKIGSKRSYKENGHSRDFGYGLVDAASAVEAVSD